MHAPASVVAQGAGWADGRKYPVCVLRVPPLWWHKVCGLGWQTSCLAWQEWLRAHAHCAACQHLRDHMAHRVRRLCRAGYRAVWDTVPCGIPCCAGYHAARDTMLRVVPCRVGYRAVRDTVPCGISCRAGYRAVRDTVPCGIPCHAGYRERPRSNQTISVEFRRTRVGSFELLTAVVGGAAIAIWEAVCTRTAVCARSLPLERLGLPRQVPLRVQRRVQRGRGGELRARRLVGVRREGQVVLRTLPLTARARPHIYVYIRMYIRPAAEAEYTSLRIVTRAIR
jgi:hypothetical protein